MRFSALLLLLQASCLLDWRSLRELEAGAPPEDAGPEDAGCTSKIVINEIRADGATSNDEFIELYNDSSCATSLQSWTIQYSSASGSAPITAWTGAADDSIAAKGFFLVHGEGFAPPATAKAKKWTNAMFPQSGLLSKAGGGVALFSSQNQQVDSVAYATLTTGAHPFVRPPAGQPAPNPPTNQSIGRKPDGANTSSSVADFKVMAMSTPAAPN